MDAEDDRINAWLEDLEPDEPLAVAQVPYETPRRWHPVVIGVAAIAGVVALGMGVMNLMQAGDATSREPDTTAVADAAIQGAVGTPTASPTDGPPSAATGEEQGPPPQAEAPEATVNGSSALGIGEGTPTTPPDEPDPYDQTDPTESSLTQHLVRAGNQWMTHAGAEEAVRTALTKGQASVPSAAMPTQVHAVQSLPFANIGRIVQVRAWMGDGVRSLWAVPVKDDGTVLAEPWLVSSEQRPLIDGVPEPSGLVDREEAIAVLTKAGWTQVDVAASGVHPNIPDILIVRATGVPPHGNQPVSHVIWLGGPAGKRHVLGV